MSATDTVAMEQLHYVTRRFVALQGLRRLAWAGPLLAWLALEVQREPAHAWFWLFLASLPAAVAGHWLAQRWYARVYGTVSHDENEWARSAYRALAVFLAVVGAIVVFNLRYPDTIAPFAVELGWGPLLVAAIVGTHGWTLRRVRTDRMWIAVGVGVVGLVPVGAFTGGVNPLNTFEGVLATVITTLAAVWIADHRFLARSLASRGPAGAEAGGAQG